jgi:hypothetical protein
MKKILLISILCMAYSFAWSETMWDKALTPAAVNLVASTNNTTAGTAVELPGGVGRFGLWVTATGYAATTNGSLIVSFSIYNGTTWTDAANGNIKLTFSTLGAATSTRFDWFEIPGATQIRVGGLNNSFVGNVSNISVRLSAIGP